MKNILKQNTIEKKYFYFSRLVRLLISILYPMMFLVAPLKYKSLLLFIWFALFIGSEYVQEFYLRRIITKPIISITDAAQKIASLDFKARCEVQSDDELGILSTSLNTLSFNLQKAMGELNLANEQLKKDVQHERILLEQRKELVDVLSHEMKTPLGLIRAYTEGLKVESSEEKRQQYMKAILSAAERMNHTIVSLLDLSALEAGTSSLSEECFDFIELVETVGGRLLLDVPGAKYRFSYELPEEKIFIKADKQRMEQVLENLISNAKKYVYENGEIRLVVKQENLQIYFSIFNQGSHISEQDIYRIWKKFYRGQKNGNNSSGLGLAIVSQILSMYQVSYGAKNQTDGVEFFFYFPTQR